MLAQRISSINSLSSLCEKTGANIDELSKAIGMDHRIGPHFLKASVGFGGSCFQKDILNLVYLCKFYGLDEVAEYWHQVVKINDYQKNRFAQKIIDHFGGDLTGKKIAILGWAFKANTNDSRESASIYVVGNLLEQKFRINVFYPKINEDQIKSDLLKNFKNKGYSNKQINSILQLLTVKNKIYEAILAVDAIAILTEWKVIKNYDYSTLSDNVKLFDGRYIINKI